MEFPHFAAELRGKPLREKSFKEESACCAVDSVSFAPGVPSDVTEPGDHGNDAVQKDTRNQESSGAQKKRPRARPALRRPSAPRRTSSGTPAAISGDTWQSAPDGAAPTGGSAADQTPRLKAAGSRKTPRTAHSRTFSGRLHNEGCDLTPPFRISACPMASPPASGPRESGSSPRPPPP